MERRWARARALMAERGLDALLVSNEENFQYFTGATGTLGLHYSVTRPAALVFPLVGEPVAIIGEILNHSVRMTTYLSDVRGFTNVLTFPADMVVEAIGGLEGKVGRVGVELGQEQRMGIPVGDYMSIVDALPNVKFEDAADQIVKMRMVKTPEEAAYMRQAADITGRARQHLFDEVVPGMTERDVVRRLRQLMLEEGADRTSFIHLIANFPPCHTQHHLDRPLQKGNVLYIDAGAYVRYHTIDYARFASLGPASDEDKRAHDVLLEANARMIDALKPGVTCAELHHLAAEVVGRAGYEIVPTGRMGHGQGLQFTEPPSICPEDHTVLEEGMVISTEPEVALNLLWEDVHVITADGHDQLTAETVEFREIPFA
jgi:Xaa-Pro aminopeptidase